MEALPCFGGFLTIGALTVYFDFLNNPILTLCLPLSCSFLRLSSTGCLERKNATKTFLVLSVFWVVGYGGLWVAKLLLATVVTGHNVFVEAAEQVMFRSGVGEHASSYGTSPSVAIAQN